MLGKRSSRNSSSSQTASVPIKQLPILLSPSDHLCTSCPHEPVSGIALYSPFRGWLISLSTVSLRSACVVESKRISFFLKTFCYPTAWTGHLFLIHSSDDGHWAPSIPRNKGVQTSLGDPEVNFFGYISRSGIIGSYGSSKFWRNLHTFIHTGCTISQS